MNAPPPPPPHGETPRSSGLPPGKYDIFVIPEHSAGSGFLYLPSLKPNVNSFAAGFASALILVALSQSMAPAFRAWWESFQGLGNMGVTLLIFGVGFGAWALGRTQKDGQHSSSGQDGPYNAGGAGGGSAGPSGFASSSSGSNPNGGAHRGTHTRPPPPPHSNAPPPPPPGDGRPPPQQQRPQSPPPASHPPPPQPEPDKPKSSWQRPPQPNATQSQSPKGSWEKAREETRKKEEERKAKEAEQKRREDAAKRLAELRAKEARERQEREKERERKEKEAKDKKLREEAENRRKELAEKLRKEKEEKAKEERAKEEQKKEAAAAAAATTTTTEAAARGSSYAYSGVGERTSMWPNGRPNVPSQAGSAGTSATKSAPSPEKRPPVPTARTYVSTPDDDAYSYRPYDQQKKKHRRPSMSSFTGSDASWAQSQTTARTSPPPSVRGPYTTKDPDKIVIQAVYLFMNQYAKTPASQLVSGIGSVTDGLILRITTEGLFIDDDVRGVPQREWDVKAWTLKLTEIWCPPHCLNSSTSATPNSSGPKSAPHLLYKMATAKRHAERDGATKVLNGEEADVYLTEMLRACKDCCRLGFCERKFKDTNIPSATGQSGTWKTKGLHVLRATVRDQEGKRYIFVINETESWKLAFGLSRLRGGTQVRQLGVAGLAPSEARGILETLGWS